MNANQRVDRNKVQRSASLFFFVLALACLLSTWPAWAAPEGPEVETPAPDTAVHPEQEQLEAIVRQRYPLLLKQRLAGIPVVTVLLNHDGTLAATDLEISTKDAGEPTASRRQFARFGHKATNLSYIGVARLDLPLNTVVVVFGGRSASDPERAP